MTGANSETRVVYTDLDGTMFGKGGSLFHTASGEFTMVGAEALSLCAARGVTICFASGRSVRLLREDCRVLGVSSYIAEAGCVLVRDRGATTIPNCEPFGGREGVSVFDEVAATGGPELLFRHFGPALAYHEPWYRDHEYSHLLRGNIDTGAANELLAGNGLGELKVVDNGVIEDRGYQMPFTDLHAYHLIPHRAGKGSAIRLDLEISGLTSEQAIACGDSAQDLEMAGSVRTFYVMANALESHSGLTELLAAYDNVWITGKNMVEGFSEAVLRELNR